MMTAIWIVGIVVFLFILLLMALSAILTSAGLVAKLTRTIPDKIIAAANAYSSWLNGLWRKTWGKS